MNFHFRQSIFSHVHYPYGTCRLMPFPFLFIGHISSLPFELWTELMTTRNFQPLTCRATITTNICYSAENHPRRANISHIPALISQVKDVQNNNELLQPPEVQSNEEKWSNININFLFRFDWEVRLRSFHPQSTITHKKRTSRRKNKKRKLDCKYWKVRLVFSLLSLLSCQTLLGAWWRSSPRDF